MTGRICTVAIRDEKDVVLARQRARQVAGLLDFDAQDQTRIATAVSEIARNAFRYAGGGRVELHLTGRTSPQVLEVRVVDDGPGITDLPSILEGRYRSATGLGIGIVGSKRLMDHVEVETSTAGTTVVLRKLLPSATRTRTDADLAALVTTLASERPASTVDELLQQNRELLRALDELSRRQEDLVGLNRELEDTNRGVVALYAELDERADHLRRADELKSRFLSNMSHEFRTPVNSIQALSRILLDRLDGELTSEQERQVTFIRQAADSLAELVGDLLDLAKVEAGKTVVRPVEFDVANLFGALRGMLRPLLVTESVSLVFEPPDERIPLLHTDEAKVSQILRNFVSNALKFTEHGEVRVKSSALPDGRVEFAVSDTGIGIAPEHRELIFQEFSQVESPVQRRVKGTGLGLPLCRKLAHLLGGAVTVDSTPHVGSTFRLVIPAAWGDSEPTALPDFRPEPGTIPVLLVEDHAETALLYEKYLATTPYRVCHVRTLRDARAALTQVAPQAIVLDVLLEGEDAWPFLTELKRRHETARIPVVVATSVEDSGKGLALGADAYCVKPLDRSSLLRALQQVVVPSGQRRVLVVDDEEISRYLLRQTLARTAHLVFEAASGADGLRAAAETQPDVVCLDLSMPDMDGTEVLERLKAEPATRDIPVVVVTGQALDTRMRAHLLERAAAVVAKDQLSSLPTTLDHALGASGTEPAA